MATPGLRGAGTAQRNGFTAARKTPSQFRRRSTKKPSSRIVQARLYRQGYAVATSVSLSVRGAEAVGHGRLSWAGDDDADTFIFLRESTVGCPGRERVMPIHFFPTFRERTVGIRWAALVGVAEDR